MNTISTAIVIFIEIIAATSFICAADLKLNWLKHLKEKVSACHHTVKSAYKVFFHGKFGRTTFLIFQRKIPLCVLRIQKTDFSTYWVIGTVIDATVDGFLRHIQESVECFDSESDAVAALRSGSWHQLHDQAPVFMQTMDLRLSNWTSPLRH